MRSRQLTRPANGEFPEPPPIAPANDGPALRQRGLRHRDPALTGAEDTDTCCRGPGLVQGLQQGVHRLTGNVSRNQGLGQALGEFGRALQAGQVGGERERHRPAVLDEQPARPAADLVAGAVDHRSAPRAHRRPRAGDGTFFVLAQHVHGAHHRRRRAGQFEPALSEAQRVRLRRALSREDSFGIDLQPEYADRRVTRGEPAGQLDRGDRSGPKPQVDDQRRRVLGSAAQPPGKRPQQPSIDAAQPVGRGRSTGGNAPGTSPSRS